MTDDPQQPPQPPRVDIEPGAFVRYGPVGTIVGAGELDGRKVVILRIECTVGMLMIPLDPPHADRVGRELVVGARQAATGLTIVGRT